MMKNENETKERSIETKTMKKKKKKEKKKKQKKKEEEILKPEVSNCYTVQCSGRFRLKKRLKK